MVNVQNVQMSAFSDRVIEALYYYAKLYYIQQGASYVTRAFQHALLDVKM